MNPYVEFNARVHKIVGALVESGEIRGDLTLDRVVCDPPRDPSHGDLTTNAAMVLAKQAGMKPRDIAALICKQLQADKDISSVEIAGPGFINIRLDRSWWASALRAIVLAGSKYGRSNMGKGEAVNVEYVSANPTGPLHVGHCRGAVFGDALAELLDVVGYNVTKEYYINDAGAQVDVLARSAHLRYLEALGEDIGSIPEGLYPGDYMIPVGEALAKEYGGKYQGSAEIEWLEIFRNKSVEMMLDLIRSDLDSLNIRHELFFSEKSLSDKSNDRIARSITTLREQGAVYEGRLPPPKGQLPDDWEDREQTLFRSTDYGDDVDRALLKSDGSYTYFASDIAYHLDKFLRGFKLQILIVGADHGGYVKRMTAAVKAITGGEGSLDVKLCQLVRLYRDGEPVKMSKRSGDFVTLRDVVEEVGKDVVRFIMLYRKNEAPLDFDFVKVTEQSRDNPVFYVQYASARMHSVFRQAGEHVPETDLGAVALAEADLSLLNDESELAIIKLMAQYPGIVEGAARNHEPHRIAFYLYELASAFHSHWNRGKESPQLRFINPEDRALTRARLALIKGLSVVLTNGLAILGVDAVEEM